MKKLFFRLLAFLALKARLYYFWSRVYRFFWEREYLEFGNLEYRDIYDIQEAVRCMQWRKDTWLMLFDAISYPEATHYRFLHGEPAGDCDDIALYAIDRLYNLALRNSGILPRGDGSLIPVDMSSFGLMSIPFCKKTGISGHNVGVFRYYCQYESKYLWACISNWYEGQIVWSMNEKESVVKYVCWMSGAKYCLGWAIADLDLKLVEYHWKADI